MIGTQDKWFVRGAVGAVGFLPVTALALAFGDWVSLPTAVVWMLAPAALAVAALGIARPVLGRTLAIAVLAGLLATFFYDVARLCLTQLGGMSDGIPNIGRLLLGDMNAPTSEVFGLAYAYRYIGDGGGLAIAYAMGRRYSTASGLAFGAAICLCLWATLAAFPVAQALLFPLTPYALGMVMAGHLVFGGVLGTLMARWLPVKAAPVPTITLTVREAVVIPANDALPALRT